MSSLLVRRLPEEVLRGFGVPRWSRVRRGVEGACERAVVVGWQGESWGREAVGEGWRWW